MKRFNTAMSKMENIETQTADDQTSQDGLDSEKEPRLRTLTEKAQEEYDKTLKMYYSKLSLLKGNVDYEMGTFKSEDQTYESVTLCKKRIENALTKYLNLAEDFSQYLKRKYTADSLEQLRAHELVYTSLELAADEIFRDMQKVQKTMTKTKSVRSVSTRTSGRSSVTSSIARMKARAEAAKTSLEFAAKEAELKKADAEIYRQKDGH